MIKERNQTIRKKHAYGTSKDLVCKNKEIKYNNLIKQHKKLLAVLMLQKKS